MRVSCSSRCSYTGKSIASGKLGAVIAEMYLFVLDVHDHVHILVIVEMAKCKRYRNLLIANGYQGWSNVIN